MPIDVKTAVAKGREYVGLVFPVPPPEVRLEEVELAEDGRHWYVTFSIPGPQVDLFGAPFSAKREYKTVELDAETGEARAIRIRTVNV